MKWIQICIMWSGIAIIFWFVTERMQGHGRYFWEYTLIAVLVTTGLILTVEAVKRSRSKGQENKSAERKSKSKAKAQNDDIQLKVNE